MKAHIALHQVYGVDLNATAVELAEISLWLDTMVAGLQAPWFGLHLRRGNSLIGARRAVYAPSLLTKKAWLTTTANDAPLGDEIGMGIHHFLLPSHGWGAVIDTAEAKTYAPGKREELRLWRNGIRGIPSAAIKKRLTALAERVETLWGFTLRRLTIAESEIRRDITLWGMDPEDRSETAVTRERIEEVLHDENGAYRRLRRVMDAWCALWSWPLTTDIEPPDWDQWVGGVEAVLGVPLKAGKFEKYGQTSLAGDLSWEELDLAEDTDRTFAQALPIEKTLDVFPWLTVADSISLAQGFFHWELDFAPMFARGGFDLQVGNPPWVRPDWDEAGVLAEFDPWWQLADKPAEAVTTEKRDSTLALDGAPRIFLDERAKQAGLKEHLGSAVDRPVLAGLHADMYRCFMEGTWRVMKAGGIVALIHPESHFTELRAKFLRRETYRRLRRHWQFQNQLKLFAEIGNTREYGVHIYGGSGPVCFLQGSSLYHPATVTRSFCHDGSGDAPGVKDAGGGWDLRPHAERIVEVGSIQLANWAALIDEPGTSSDEARMMYPVNRDTAEVLDKLATAPRVGEIGFDWTVGWQETADRKRGLFKSASAVPGDWTNVILQGPHLGVANPLSKQPNPTMFSHRDYSDIDLESIDESFVPRTNYQVAKPQLEYLSAYPKWHEVPSCSYFRLAWRRRADPGMARTLHAVVVPPGPCHVHPVLSAHIGDDVNTVIASAFWASLPIDFFVKAAGVDELSQGVVRRIPHIFSHELRARLLLRALRLNCLVQPYASLWEGLYSRAWQQDSWVPHIGVDHVDRSPLGAIAPQWEWRTPLRIAADRRQALVENDAIVAIMLGITAEELLTIYRTQFPVLQKYERDALYDANGRQLPGKLASEYRKKGVVKAEDLTVDGVTYVEPFVGVDRERDMELAHKHFSDIASA